MFVLSALVYPLVLALLCLGGGLLVDRLSGGWLAGAMLPAVGLAALIVVADLATYVPALPPATPYILAGVGVLGFGLGWSRVRAAARGWRARGWELALGVAAFVVACAPVLFAGRPTFSAYMVLTDSALHMVGADYLVRHGQSYAHLDLVNSYGQYINNYYNHNYPTGADALLGGTAFLTRVPVIWAFQPFNAAVLAVTSGPAWLLARRLGLAGGWAAAAALAATVPALVYAYELIGSIKEITALPLILSLGALVAGYPRWLRRGPRGALPFGLVVAAGVGALGVAFGAWAIVAAVVLVGGAIDELAAARQRPLRLLTLLGSGAIVVVLCAWPTWHDAAGSVQVAQGIEATTNSGNLLVPLQWIQVFGTWLTGNYQNAPVGAGLVVSDFLIALGGFAGLVGALHTVRTREFALAGWFALMIGLAFLVSGREGTWAGAKTLVLTSPVLILLAWGGVGALRAADRRPAFVLAVLLAGGVLASDLVQYHDTSLAPTARYDELASIDSRFHGHGPALFTDFDEYALYALRDLDVGGPDFLYPPVGLLGVDNTHGSRVRLGHARAAALLAYPLIITRRDPATPRPPAAYRLVWQGTYYQVWRRTPGAPAALAALTSPGTHATNCGRVKAIATRAAAHHATLISDRPAAIVTVDLAKTNPSAVWEDVSGWYVNAPPDTLRAQFRVPVAGRWNVWLVGEIMPAVELRIDGRHAGTLSAQISGDSLVPDTTTPLPVELSAGRHRLAITRNGTTLAPGNGAAPVLTAIFLTPAGAGNQQLRTTPARQWRTLCGHPHLWIEAVIPPSAAARRARSLEIDADRRSPAQGRAAPRMTHGHRHGHIHGASRAPTSAR